jgi:hypothetical protein
MRSHLVGLALIVVAASTASAQQRTGCIGKEGVPLDSLYAQARRLHPDVAKPQNQSSAVVVALVYDNTCTIVRHAMGRVDWQEGGIERILGQVFPDSTRLTLQSFEISGFAAIGENPNTDLRPVVAWGLLTPRGLPKRPSDSGRP